RTLIYWRPRAVVILDRVVLTDPSAGVAFAFHSTVEPLRAGPRTSIGVGDSRLDLTTVEPSHPQIQGVRQPTSPPARPHRPADPGATNRRPGGDRWGEWKSPVGRAQRIVNFYTSLAGPLARPRRRPRSGWSAGGCGASRCGVTRSCLLRAPRAAARPCPPVRA